MVDTNNNMDIFLNSRYVGKCRSSAGYQMTTITFRRKIMHFVFLCTDYYANKLHFAFELICMIAGAKRFK